MSPEHPVIDGDPDTPMGRGNFMEVRREIKSE